MSEEEAIERINDFKTISIMYGNTFAMHIEQLKQLQEDLDTILQLLEQKDNKIQQLKYKIKKDIDKFSNNKNEVFMTQSSQIDASLISYGKELLNILEE